MGLLIHYGKGWKTTDKGAKFSTLNKNGFNSYAWYPELVDDIIIYLKNEQHLNK